MTDMTEEYRGRRILVTGGAGAIGSQLVPALIAAGAEEVVVLDDLSAGRAANVPLDPRVRFRVGSLLDDDALEDVFDGPPLLVFHLAALFANQNSLDHPLSDLRINGEGTLRALLAAHRHSATRFVLAATSCATPAGPGEKRDDDLAPLDFSTPYQITKGLGEQYCRFFHRRYGLDTVRVRFFNSYGPGEMPGRYRNVIPNFFHRALSGQPLIVLGSGEDTRDWTFVDDIVAGLLRAGRVEAASGQVLNLGTGRETRVIEIAEQINRLTGNTAGIELRPRRSWDDHLTRRASTEKTSRILDHRCTVSVEDGLERTAEWFRAEWPTIAAEVQG